jgi:hypothetical protein
VPFLTVRQQTVTAVIALASAAPAAYGQLRVVTYNTAEAARPTLGTVLQAIGNDSVNGIARPIDVLSLQEQTTPSSTTQQILNVLNGIYGAGTYARANLSGQTMGAGMPGLIYNTQTVSLITDGNPDLDGNTFPDDGIVVNGVSSSGAARSTLRYRLRPVGYTSTADFYVYSSHFKSDTSDQSRRLVEAQQIRDNADALGQGAHVLYTGDFNLYTSSESAYAEFLSAGDGQAFDPINRPGSWSNGASFKDIHTQAPATTQQYPGQITGGMDDRFDFQLASGEMLDDEGLSYIAGTYRAFGNDGTHDLNGSITTGDNTARYPASLRNALEDTTDHLPVVADYQLPAKMSVSGIVPTAVIKGATVANGAAAQITVSNTAPVAVAIGADELDYSASGTGAVTGSASGTDAALNGGNTHNLALSTATAGAKTGTVNVNSTSQAVANGTFSQNVSYNVLEHSQGSFEAASDVDAKSIDFGYVPAGFANRTAGFSVHNRVALAGFTAGLDVDSVVNAGSTAQLTTSAAPLSNLAAGSQSNLTATLNPSTAGNLTATHTLAVTDQNIPGATSGTSLVLSTTARVFTVATFDVTGHMDLLAGETLNTGPFRIADGVTLTRNGPGAMNVTGAQDNGAGSTLILNGGPNTFATDAGSATSRALTVQANAPTTFNATQHLAALYVGTDSTATLAADGSRMIVTGALTVGAGGVLDLHDNDLLIDYGGASIETTIRDMVLDGRIDSDAAGNTVFAIADNAEWGEAAFNGEAIDDTTIVGKYTYFGDANLDGQVTTDDYVAVDLGLGEGDSWVEGDLDISGVVTTDDYVVIDLNLGSGTDDPLAFAEEQAAMIALHAEMFGQSYLDRLAYAQENGFQLIPEPAGAAALFAAATLLMQPRRRRARLR